MGLRLWWALFALLATVAPAHAQASFDGWASVIVAGDWRDGRGRPIPVFDNAIRDLRSGLLDVGLPASTMLVATLRPDVPAPRTVGSLLTDVARLTEKAPGGCLVYLTSHGSPRGLVFGPRHTLTPATLGSLVDRWCGAKPTVVVVSACFAGVFLDELDGPNRLVLTAARSDRASFGCASGTTWPYFDGCVIEALRATSDFVSLGQAATACVARAERIAGLEPPSEPQLRVGDQVVAQLPHLVQRSSARPTRWGASPGTSKAGKPDP